jgi:hypothetical protein
MARGSAGSICAAPAAAEPLAASMTITGLLPREAGSIRAEKAMRTSSGVIPVEPSGGDTDLTTKSRVSGVSLGSQPAGETRSSSSASLRTGRPVAEMGRRWKVWRSYQPISSG